MTKELKMGKYYSTTHPWPWNLIVNFSVQCTESQSVGTLTKKGIPGEELGVSPSRAVQKLCKGQLGHGAAQRQAAAANSWMTWTTQEVEERGSEFPPSHTV